MTKVHVEAKRELLRKQCCRCGRISTYPMRMKESWASVLPTLWQEYEGMVICTKCLVGTRAA